MLLCDKKVFGGVFCVGTLLLEVVIFPGNNPPPPPGPRSPVCHRGAQEASESLLRLRSYFRVIPVLARITGNFIQTEFYNDPALKGTEMAIL